MSETISWHNRRVRLRDLKPWRENPRRMSRRHAERLLESWRRLGQAHLILVDPDLTVIDGHQRLDALLAAYGPDYEVEVRQASRPLTDQERRLAVLWLHAGAVGQWDWDALANWDPQLLVEGGLDREMAQLLREDLKAVDGLLESLADTTPREAAPPPVPEDRLAQLAEKWGTAPGQIWHVPSLNVDGHHVVAIGDSTDADFLARAMGDRRAAVVFTDPPYGVAIGAKNRDLRKLGAGMPAAIDLTGDEDEQQAMALLRRALEAWRETVMRPDTAVFIMAAPGPLVADVVATMREVGLPPRHILVWAKNRGTFSIGRLDYDYQHELIVYTWPEKRPTSRRRAFRTSLWEVPRPSRSPLHPTMKPVELPEGAIRNHSERGEVVFDGFAGSGTTAVAAERTGRLAVVVELDPRFAAGILERLAAMGCRPQKVG